MSDPDNKKKWIDKVVKLFQAIDHTPTGEQKGGTEAEMMAAVTKARELMARHQISMADIELAKGTSAAEAVRITLEENRVYTRRGTTLAQYDLVVAQAVETLTDTRTFTRTTRTWEGKTFISVVFLGDEADVALAGELFPLWLQTVRREARRVFGGGKNVWTPSHTAYAVGFGVRLGERARQRVASLSKKEEQTWGLVLASKQNAIAQRMDEIGVKQGTNRRKELDRDAFYRGYVDGANMSIETNLLPGETARPTVEQVHVGNEIRYKREWGLVTLVDKVREIVWMENWGGIKAAPIAVPIAEIEVVRKKNPIRREA